MMRLFGWKRSRATAAVEMAVVSPVMFAILFGIIEFGWLFTVRHTMVNAAREGARFGALQGITEHEIEDRAKQYLRPLGIDGRCTVHIEMPTSDDPTVVVRITVPRSSVSLVGNFFHFTGGELEGEAAMRREGM